jgi:hypothetical protein
MCSSKRIADLHRQGPLIQGYFSSPILPFVEQVFVSTPLDSVFARFPSGF